MFDLEYYERPDGERPVAQFIDGLDVKMRVKAFAVLEILAEYGNG
jgi:hypothetical protein